MIRQFFNSHYDVLESVLFYTLLFACIGLAACFLWPIFYPFFVIAMPAATIAYYALARFVR